MPNYTLIEISELPKKTKQSEDYKLLIKQLEEEGKIPEWDLFDIGVYIDENGKLRRNEDGFFPRIVALEEYC